MNTKSILTITLLFTLTAATNVMHAVGKVILRNNTGWNIAYKFAEPGRAANEGYVATNGTAILGDSDEYLVRALSIRRSGVGSTVSAPWTAIDVNKLMKDTEGFLKRPLPNNISERNIIWEVQAGYVGWSINVTEFISKKPVNR